MGQTVAFFSYTRADDRASDGRLTAIRDELERRMRTAMGDQSVDIFQDTDDIKHGEDWRERLEEALRNAVFLIPVVTPSYFASRNCMIELDLFRKREADLGRDDMILPIYWIKDLAADHGHIMTEQQAFIHSRQSLDWREFAFPDVNRELLIGAVMRFADDVAERTFMLRVELDRIEKEKQRLAQLDADAEQAWAEWLDAAETEFHARQEEAARARAEQEEATWYAAIAQVEAVERDRLAQEEAAWRIVERETAREQAVVDEQTVWEIEQWESQKAAVLIEALTRAAKEAIDEKKARERAAAAEAWEKMQAAQREAAVKLSRRNQERRERKWRELKKNLAGILTKISIPKKYRMISVAILIILSLIIAAELNLNKRIASNNQYSSNGYVTSDIKFTTDLYIPQYIFPLRIPMSEGDTFSPRAVDDVEQFFRDLPTSCSSPFIKIVGHTDAKGSTGFNYELGRQRAKVIASLFVTRARALVNQGVRSDLWISTVEYGSRGENRLLHPDDPLSIENRRVELFGWC